MYIGAQTINTTWTFTVNSAFVTVSSCSNPAESSTFTKSMWLWVKTSLQSDESQHLLAKLSENYDIGAVSNPQKGANLIAMTNKSLFIYGLQRL